MRKQKYYIYPRFRVARDMSNSDFYEKVEEDAVLLNVGSGEFFYHPRFKNVDYFEPNLEKNFKHFERFDLREASGFDEKYNNVSAIYFGHVIEHIPESKIDVVLSAFYRSLKSGGVLRVVTPDAKLIYDAYCEGRHDFFRPYKSWFTARGNNSPSLEDYVVQLLATPKSSNYTAYDNSHMALKGELVRQQFNTLSREDFLNWLTDGCSDNNESGTDHLMWFDHEKLEEIAINIGFKYIRSAFGQSRFTPFRQVPLFDETLPSISLYADLIKE